MNSPEPAAPPRLRMFAGPNGSGKSTIKSELKTDWLGVYINPDEIEAAIKKSGSLNLEEFSVQTTQTEASEFFRNSTLLRKAGLQPEAESINFSRNRIDFTRVNLNAYYASVAADFLRQKLILAKKSFSFETVMSSPDKVELLKKSHDCGYRNYLYFVATDDPQINVSRVEIRVKEGGHGVPADKITTRYYRSLDLLLEAVRNTNGAFIFDNSGSELVLLAEVTGAESLELKVDSVPGWFERYVLDKVGLDN
jgi:predicted ABC-type ATPase